MNEQNWHDCARHMRYTMDRKFIHCIEKKGSEILF